MKNCSIWTMVLFVILATVIFTLAISANAAPVPPGTSYDASTGVLNWQAPTLNAAGTALNPGELKDCFWTMTWTNGGSMLVSARAVTAGTAYVINAPLAFGTGTAVGYCTNNLDVKGPSATWPVVFKALPVPQAPVLTN